MKTLASLGMAVVLVAGGALAWADHHEAGEQPQATAWFDMENCACCKHMGEHMDMMMDIKWENHTIKSGGIMTAVVPDQHKEKWDQVCKKMEEVEKQLTEGEEMPLCGFCQSYASLLEAGATVEEVPTGFGRVTLITSDDPEVVAKIHTHFKRTQKEHKKMMAMAEGEASE